MNVSERIFFLLILVPFRSIAIFVLNDQKISKNFSREEKEYIVQYVNENRKILEDKSNSVHVYMKKQDKWRNLVENLKAFRVMRDWKEVRGAYQRWKLFAKKNIAAFWKRGTNILASLLPTEFDYIIYTYNICP